MLLCETLFISRKCYIILDSGEIKMCPQTVLAITFLTIDLDFIVKIALFYFLDKLQIPQIC